MKALDLESVASVSVKAGGRPCDEFLVKRNATELSCWIAAREGDMIRVEYMYSPSSFFWQIDLLIDGILVESKTQRPLKWSHLNTNDAFESCSWREQDEVQVHNVGMKLVRNNAGYLASLPSLASTTGSGAIEVIFYRTKDGACNHKQTRTSIFDDGESKNKTRLSRAGDLPLTHYVDFIKHPCPPLSSSQRYRLKKKFDQKRPGLAPWVSFKFMYRSQAELWQANIASPSMRSDTNWGIVLVSPETSRNEVRTSAVESQVGRTRDEVSDAKGGTESSVPCGRLEQEAQASDSKVFGMVAVRQVAQDNTSGPISSMMKAETNSITVTLNPDPRMRGRKQLYSESRQHRARVASVGPSRIGSPVQQLLSPPVTEFEKRPMNDALSDRKRCEPSVATFTAPMGDAATNYGSGTPLAASGMPQPSDAQPFEQPRVDIPHESSGPRQQEEMITASGDDQSSENSSSRVIGPSLTTEAMPEISDEVGKTVDNTSTCHTSEDTTRKRRRERIEELEKEKETLTFEEDQIDDAYEKEYEAVLESEVEHIKWRVGEKRARLSALERLRVLP